MKKENHRIATLISRRLTSTLTADESRELDDWINACDENKSLAASLLSRENLHAMLKDTYRAEQKVWRYLEESLFNETVSLPKDDDAATLYPLRGAGRSRKWASAAAVLILLIGIGALLHQQVKTSLPAETVVVGNNDIDAPVANRAIIKMAGGRTVYLDSIKPGPFATQGNMTLVKSDDDRITYQRGSDPVSGEIQYNTLYNPRGSKVIEVQLADGSRVWLNAASSISYPVAFMEAERAVQLEGEAYFEIAEDKFHPFIVSTDKQSVEVLGTHFSISSYDDEPEQKTTLLEGRLRVTAKPEGLSNKDPGQVLLAPGQQSILSSDAQLSVVPVNTEEFIDWKNGIFIFNNESLASITRRISRWYNVTIEYPEGTPASEYFKGRLSRFEKVSTVLDMLEETGDVHFAIRGKTILVYPSKAGSDL